MKKLKTFAIWLTGAILIVLLITYPSYSPIVVSATLLIFIIYLFSYQGDIQRQKALNEINEYSLYPEIKPLNQEFETLDDYDYFYHYDFVNDYSRLGWYPLKKLPQYSYLKNFQLILRYICWIPPPKN